MKLARLNYLKWYLIIPLLGIPGLVQAQQFSFWKTSVLADFSDADVESFKSTIVSTLEKSPDTREIPWQSADGKHRGRILPKFTFESRGQTCRRTLFELRGQDSQPERYRFDICRGPSGWQISRGNPEFTRTELESLNNFFIQVLNHQEPEHSISWVSSESDKSLAMVPLVRPDLPDNCRMAAITLMEQSHSIHGQYRFCKNTDGRWRYDPGQ